MPAKLFFILRCSIMLAVIALAAVGTIYVLDVFSDAALQRALGKVFALLGIYTGSALSLTVLADIGRRRGVENPAAQRRARA